ncbi:MAG TPA: DUF4260 domain-containing protein [Anaerolineales bacterium]|nr:DUF4260 domain-containing protein [Anaerolineales bacterium]
MKILLKLEALALWGLSICLFSRLDYAWWWYPLLFFVPDLSMVGYVFGARLGALVYNVIHHHALAIGLYILGFALGIPALQLSGVVLLGHSSLDRVLGYGLKYPDSFQNTHLGLIGTKAE